MVNKLVPIIAIIIPYYLNIMFIKINNVSHNPNIVVNAPNFVENNPLFFII
jgi:hypothetical protein